jgi:hypothetical protein
LAPLVIFEFTDSCVRASLAASTAALVAFSASLSSWNLKSFGLAFASSAASPASLTSLSCSYMLPSWSIVYLIESFVGGRLFLASSAKVFSKSIPL